MTDGFEFPVEVIKTSRRRSASIYLDGDGVKVRVPEGISDSYVRDLIARKSPWIKRKLREAELAAPPRPREFVSGETFSYLGKNYRLKVLNGDASSVRLRGGYLEASVSGSLGTKEEQIRSLLVDWYQRHARGRLQEKTSRYAKILQVKPRSVSVKDYKSRWGSCSAKGDISYNWRVVIAPHRIVDYVVVHELCHLLEHNHSPDYWHHVERVIPDFRERRQWLKQNSRQLEI
ncbi:MAG: SprT family zinc-dependent metalloprotease [Candidatus Dadabacteria bacterium]|nr:SprT family zinc-dependent metalloprotease [Candidatus Dadabacteria bacterium]MDE0477912.1 SprT family zinc-dependent metalloprotease [Candidatus Dadabacteria bacterium]